MVARPVRRGWQSARPMRIASPAFRSRTPTTAKCWCAAMPAATSNRSSRRSGRAGSGSNAGRRHVRMIALSIGRDQRSGARRCKAHASGAAHLESHGAGRRHDGRDLSPLSRHRHVGARHTAFPCRDQASARPALAGDGRAGDARRRTTRRLRSTAPSLPATAAARRRSIRRR